jgi:hypothetical protein
MSAPKPGRRERSPRREAGRTAVPKPKRKIAFRLVVEAQEMLVEYEPNWSEGEFACGHFEFKSPHKPPRRIAISETGYQSHFAPMAEIDAYESPEAYARAYVESVLNAFQKGKSRMTDRKQLSLF